MRGTPQFVPDAQSLKLVDSKEERGMGRQRSQAKRKKSLGKLFEAGAAAAVLGAGLLVAPALMGDSAVAHAFAAGARIPAVLALLIGAGLMAVHFLLRARSGQSQQAAPRQEPNWTSWAPPETLAALQRAVPQAGDISAFPDTGSDSETGALPAAPQRRRELAWSQQVFDDIEWRRFEAVCEKLFGQAGFDARTQSHGADGGVDIWLHSKHAAGAGGRRAVQALGRQAGRGEGGARIPGRDDSAQAQTRHVRHHLDVHCRSSEVRQGEWHQRARWREAAGADRQAHARAASGAAGNCLRRRILAADLRQLRHQDGRARSDEDGLPILGLRPLPGCKSMLPMRSPA